MSSSVMSIARTRVEVMLLSDWQFCKQLCALVVHNFAQQSCVLVENLLMLLLHSSAPVECTKSSKVQNLESAVCLSDSD